ncbi:hypothetical protein [Marinifilum sp. D737]|nr:hypothetical protein [Marinifilum sp. D737]MCY1633074.1 hypothetical protein [Marinifilum sp. D737]
MAKKNYWHQKPGIFHGRLMVNLSFTFDMILLTVLMKKKLAYGF